MNLACPFVLASGSPRRKYLLEQMGLSFHIQASTIEETIPPGTEPGDVVRQLALEKAANVAQKQPQSLTLGADTVVVVDGRILGKPQGEGEARSMLRDLSARTHTVYTGIALVHPATGRTETAFEATDVTFAPLSEEEIEAYVATGSPLDKAGAYGIQDDLGALFITRIDGDYYNVVGLPLHRFYRTLRERFPDLLLSL
ncbi:MAG TPA: Maf family protein [Rhodothermales bacterium]|nr:Maf family protein [Rhodothermales bacterium]